MRLSELMTHDVKTIHPGEPVSNAAERMKLNSFHHLVVEQDHQIVGVVSERDLRSAPRRDASVGDVMSTTVVTATPSTTVREAANLLRGRSIGCLPVVEKGKVVGIVTITDLLELLGKGSAHPEHPEGRWKPIRRMARTPRSASPRSGR
jgi:acetoin utilization protein AcuB